MLPRLFNLRRLEPECRALLVLFLLLLTPLPVFLASPAWMAANPFLNLAVVEPGKLIRSAQPFRADFERLHRDYGVRTILSLRNSEDPAVLDYARAHGIDWIVIKMKADDPPTPEQQALFFDLMQGRPLDPARYPGVIKNSSRTGPARYDFPVLLHCEGGADRTGVMTALYRIEFQGWTVAEAKAEMPRHWHLWYSHPGQYRFLDEYHPGRVLPPASPPAVP